MAIDFSKYGVETGPKAKVDFSKYMTQQPQPSGNYRNYSPELASALAPKAGFELANQRALTPAQGIVSNMQTRAETMPAPKPEPTVGQRIKSAAKNTGQFLADFPETFTDSATFGLSSAISRGLGTQTLEEQRARRERPGGVTGQFAGYLMPGAAIERGITAAARPFIQNMPRAGRLATTGAAAGATEAALQEGGDVAFRQESFDPVNVAIGGAAGGVIGGAIPAVQRLFNTFRPQQAPTQGPTLALPDPRQRGNMNTVRTPDVINASGKVEPFGLPEPNVAPPTRARAARQTNPYREKLERFAGQMEGAQLTPGREREEFLEAWGRFADRNDPDLETMIDLAYASRPNRVTPDLAQRARETQRMREVSGVGMPVRSMSDRYQSGVTGAAAMPESRIGVRQPSRPPQTPIQPSRTNALEIRATPVQEAEEVIQAVNQPRVRERVYNYLDEAEKNARDRIAKRRNRLSANPIDEWADHSIIMAAKLGKGTIRAADFTEELVKEFGEQIRPHADRIFRQTREVLRQQERRASKEGQEAGVFNNSGRGNANSFEQKISRGGSKRKVPFAQRWEKLRTQLVDDLAPLEGLEKRVRGSVASAEDSLYKAARVFKGTPERAAQTVQTRLAPVVEAVEQAGYTADDLGRYALAVHARDVNNAGYKSGFTNAEIEDVIQKYGSPQMEAARNQLIQINRDMLKEVVDSGVVSRELADVLNERWQNYIPLFRAFDDEAIEFGSGLSSALANVASPIKGLKGSERAVIDPLENMVKNIFQSINAAERNKVASQLAKLAQRDKDGQFIRKLDPDEKVGRKNVVNVKVNGENVKYEVEPEVYKAMLNLDQESSNMLINILSKPASLLRAGATLTPEFSLRNPMRDVLQAYVTSNSGFNPITDFGAGLIQSITKGPLYREWIDNLGAYGNIVSMDRDVHRQALEKVLKQPHSKQFVNIVTGRSLIRLLRAISDTTESATKVGEYRAARRQGQTPQESAYRARDIMDFARAGSGVRQANRIVAFLNANIQGKSKLIRAIKQNPVGTTARMFTAVTLPTVGIYAMNQALANEEQKRTIADAPNWLRDTFWLVAIPGTNQVARIPKPFDIAPLFANLPERALQFAQQNDPAAFDGFVRRTLSDAALPFQISGLLPIVEGMANYSFFREGDIIPMREQNLEFRDQYDPTRTTETAKFLARGAEAVTGGKGAFQNFSSPRIMDNTIRGLTAGLGSYATSAIDSVLQGKYFGQKLHSPLVDRPETPQKRLEQRPLAKAFLVDPMQGGKSMDTFYQNREKLQKEKASAQINERPFEKEGLLQYLNNVSGVMSDINKAVRDIERSDLSAAEKRRQIEPLIQQRNELARQTVEQTKLR